MTGGQARLPTVSVVIPTFNRAATLPEVVAPLLADPFALEVIIVDDGSTDATRDVLAGLAADDPRVRPISVPNGGAASAREIGAQAARGDVVLFLDDDVVATPGLAAGHAARHVEGSGTVVVGYMPTVRPHRSAAGAFATTFYADAYDEHCEAWERDPAEVLRRLWAGNLSMRRADATRVGMVSPSATGYHADRDLGARCIKAGLVGVFDRDLLATHRHRRTLSQFRADTRSQGRSAFAVHAAHADVLGEFDDLYRRGLSRAGRWVVASADHRLAYTVLAASLAGLVRASGRLRLRYVERRAARLLGRIEAQHAYAAARREAAPPTRKQGT